MNPSVTALSIVIVVVPSGRHIRRVPQGTNWSVLTSCRAVQLCARSAQRRTCLECAAHLRMCRNGCLMALPDRFGASLVLAHASFEPSCKESLDMLHLSHLFVTAL